MLNLLFGYFASMRSYFRDRREKALEEERIRQLAKEAEWDIWWDTGSIVYDPSQIISEKYDWKVVRVKDYEEAEEEGKPW